MERPKREETEEDLLRMQEEFLKSKSSSSAQLVNPSGKDNKEEKKGKPAAKKRLPPGVITDILEQDVKRVPIYYPSAPALGGFPVATHRGNLEENQKQESTAGPVKRKSLFARQLEKQSAKQYGIKMQTKQRVQPASSGGRRDPVAMEVVEAIPPSGSEVGTFVAPSVISGQGLGSSNASTEIERIHQENVERLDSMDASVILKEQQELLETLDPSIVAFLKNKRAMAPKQENPPQKQERGDAPEPDATNASKPDDGTALNLEELPVKPMPEFVHMDEVEPDKLEWTKELPQPPKPDDPKTGKPARFDFKGNIVSEDADLPTHMGLHHHGKEPERAGYSLEEIFLLARSANMQQRVVALDVLSNIINNAKNGYYFEAVSRPIFPALLDGGLMFILRWAVDDSMDTALGAAVHCLKETVCLEADEVGLDRVFDWGQGHIVGEAVGSKIIIDDEGEEEEATPSDSDLVQHDVIKGLLNMKILERLRYLLEIWRPQAPVVLDIFCILHRIARHSPESAYAIMQCPRLLDCMFKEFLPSSWEHIDSSGKITTAHGYPMASAMKLVRLICTAGKNMAAVLVSNYHLMNTIGRYISEPAINLRLLASEAWSLQTECWRTWSLLLTYGLAAASVSELYPVIGNSLQFINALSLSSEQHELQLGGAVLKMLEMSVCLAAMATTMHSEYAHKKPRNNESGSTEEAIPEIHWSQVSGLMAPVTQCLMTWLPVVVQPDPLKKTNLTIPMACLNVLASYFTKVRTQPGYDALQSISDIESLASALKTMVTAHPFQRILSAFRKHSMLLWDGDLKRGEDVRSLPEVGSLLGKQADQCPILGDCNTTALCTAFFRLLLSMAAIHKKVPEELFHHILQNEEVVLYVQKCCQTKALLNAGNYFAKFDNILCFQLICMAHHQGVASDRALYHHCALSLLTYLQPGDEHLGHHLLSAVIFNPDFVSDATQQLSNMDTLQMQDSEPLQLATMEQVQVTGSGLMQEAVANMADVRATYLQSMELLTQQLQRSRGLYLQFYNEVDSLIVGSSQKGLVPVDWVFMPIIHLYNMSINKSEEATSPTLIGKVTHTLQWVYFVHRCRSNLLQPVAFATQYSRLLCIFLSGSDIFLDKKVHAYLAGILKLLCRSVILDRAKLDVPVPGLSSFYDLFVMLVSQFESVSFGDSLFACYLLLPMQQHYTVKFRRAVWGEHALALRALRIPIKQLVLPIQGFLYPEESDPEMLRLYFQALLGNLATAKFTPLPYLVAVHHVNRFVYTQSTHLASFRKMVMQQVLNCRNQELKHHILYYKQANVDEQFGMELYSDLPSIRQDLLRSYESTSTKS